MLSFFRNHRTLAVLLVVLSLPVVLYPRFNRQDIKLIQPLVGTRPGEVQIDMRCYLNFVEYFRGRQPLESVSPPFSYRPLVPFLAARLPFDPFLSFNLVNVMAICLTPLILFLSVRRMGFPFEHGILGCLLYTCSFPVMYYGPSGYVDATAMLVLSLMVMVRLYEKDYWLPLLFLLGGVARETVIVAVPFLVVDLWIKQRRRLSGFVCLSAGLIAYLVAIGWARYTFGTGGRFVWTPGGVFLAQNLFRAKAYISFMLAFGIPGALASLFLVRYFRKDEDRLAIPLIVGMGSGLTLFVYSFLAAYADGRFIWTAYPFMIGLTLYYLKAPEA